MIQKHLYHVSCLLWSVMRGVASLYFENQILIWFFPFIIILIDQRHWIHKADASQFFLNTRDNSANNMPWDIISAKRKKVGLHQADAMVQTSINQFLHQLTNRLRQGGICLKSP